MWPHLPILFVDDEPDVLRAIQRTVAHAGWEVRGAGSAQEGIAVLEREDIGVVISDYRMPRVDGVAFLSQVRERWPDTERILLTAYADEGALERGINEAAIGRFLRKPWKRQVLVAIIEQAMEHVRVRREHAVLVERVKNKNDELMYLNELLQTRVEASDRALVGIRRRWDVALNAISDAIAVVGEGFRLEGVNLAAAQLAGLDDAAQLEGRRCHEALWRSSQPCTGCPLEAGSGKVIVKEPRALGRPESERHYDARAYRLPGDGRSHLCVYRDITREVAFAKEAARVDKMAAIGRLAGGVAHEINNPLHGILSFVQLAQKDDVQKDKLQRYHEVIYECAVRCRDIVQSLRDFSRQPKAGEERVVDLGQLIDKTLVLFEPSAEVAVERQDQLGSASCIGNANQLQQVLTNLVQNAIDASPKQGKVRVRLERDGSELVVAVEDTGPGVPPELRERIFEPFFTTKPEGVGTGLGLSISHGIMREHGGRLVVGEAAGGGARFEMRLGEAASAPAAGQGGTP